MKPVKIEISHKTIIFTALFLIFLLFLYQIRHFLLLLFIAVIFMSALSPLVDKLGKYKLPRGLAIIIFYILIWTAISFGIASLVPPLVEQSARFIDRLPNDISYLTQGKFDLSLLEPHLITLPQKAVQIVFSVFNNLIGLITLMVIVYYLIMERKNLHKYLLFLFGQNAKEASAEAFITKLETKLGSWVRGQLTLMLIIGLMSYAGLTFLGIEFAIPLAFLAGLLEVVPNIGPMISMIPAILVALGQSPVLALAVVALYFLIQQLENNFIVPKVMAKAVGLSPLLVIIALIIGYRVAGIAGAILSIPTTLLLEVVINEVWTKNARKL